MRSAFYRHLEHAFFVFADIGILEPFTRDTREVRHDLFAFRFNDAFFCLFLGTDICKSPCCLGAVNSKRKDKVATALWGQWSTNDDA